MNYFDEVEEIVKAGFESGQTSAIFRKVKNLLKKNSKKKEILKFAAKYIKLQEKNREETFLEKFTKPFLLDEFEKINVNFEKGVLQAVRRGLSEGDSELAKKLVKRAANTADRYITTVVNTGKLGIAQGQVIEDALQAGIKRFIYIGPDINARRFCREHLRKTYTIEEILKMDNGQCNPVAQYCGGWNCRHRWVPVIGDEFYIEETKEIILK